MSSTQSNKETNNAMRQVSILTIAEYFGIKLRVSNGGLFYIGDEKGASLHIDATRNVFHYFGESVDFKTPLFGNTGGGAIDFAIFANYYASGGNTAPLDIRKGSPTARDSFLTLTKIFSEICPGMTYLLNYNETPKFRKPSAKSIDTKISPFGGVSSGSPADIEEQAVTTMTATAIPTITTEERSLPEDIDSEHFLTLQDTLLKGVSPTAILPFYYGNNFFFNPAHCFLWSKAVFLGQDEIAAQIIKAGSPFKEKFHEFINLNKEKSSLKNNDAAQDEENEDITKQLSTAFNDEDRKNARLVLNKYNSNLTDALQALASVNETSAQDIRTKLHLWNSEKAKSVVEAGMHLAFQRNPEVLKSLIETEKVSIVPVPGNETSFTSAYSTALMRERASFASLGYQYYGAKGNYKVLDSQLGVTDQEHRSYLVHQRHLPAELVDKLLYQIRYVKTTPFDPTGKNSAERIALATPTIDGKNWNFVHVYTKNGKQERIKNSTGQNISFINRDGRFCTDGNVIPTSPFLVVVEGQLNAPSLLALQGQKGRPGYDTLVLNSTSNLKKGLPVMKQYKAVMLYLDNDIAGQNATEAAARELLSAGKIVFDARPQFIEGKAMLPLQTQDYAVIQKQDERALVPLSELSPEEAASLTGSESVVCVKTNKGAVPMREYWKDKLEKGHNDLNDALIAKDKLNPTVNISKGKEKSNANNQKI